MSQYDNDQVVETIIQLIVSNQYDIPISKLVSTYEKTESEERVLPNPLEGVITDMITNKFLESDVSISHFLSLITGTFTSAINKYIFYKQLQQNSIHFIYKGGNVLRMIEKSFLTKLPGNISQILDKYYSGDFKKSDADFSIYIDPTFTNFEKIYKDMTNMSYLLLSYIRLLFYQNPAYYFDFYKYDQEIQKNLLLDYFNKLAEENKKSENTKTLINLILGPESKRQDTLIKYEESNSNTNSLNYINQTNVQQGGSTVAVYQIKRLDEMTASNDLLLNNLIIKQKEIFGGKETNYYISINETLDFKLQKSLIKFNLARMKVNTIGVFKDENNQIQNKNLAGELIDVSILHKESHGINDFFNHQSEYIKIYKYEEGTANEFDFKAISKDYMIHDLEFILFSTVQYPWLDNKYGKRIKRLMFLYLIDMLSSNNPISLEDIKNTIFNFESQCISPLISVNEADFHKILPEIITQVNYNIDIFRTFGFKFTNFIDEYLKLLSKPMTDYEEFRKFAILIKENLDIYLKVLYDLINYIKIEKGKINMETLQEVSQFGGLQKYNNYQNYLRKKNAYLQKYKLMV